MGEQSLFLSKLKRFLAFPYLLLHVAVWSIIMYLAERKLKTERMAKGLDPLTIDKDDLAENLWSGIRTVPYVFQLMPTMIIVYLILK